MSKITTEDIWSYHQNEAVSSTKLDVFHHSPLEYFETYVTKVMQPKQSWAFDFGAAFHALMEGQAAFEQYTVPMKFKDFRTDAAQEWRDQMRNERKFIIMADKAEALRKMKARIEAHPIASQLIADTEAEVTWRRSFGKYSVQCRTDRWGDKPREIKIPGKEPLQLERWFVDFKTCTSLAQFRKNWADFGYARQRVFYSQTILSCEPDAPEPAAFWIVSESEAPYECRVFALAPDSINVARAEVMMDLKALRHCYETGEWLPPAEIETLTYSRWRVEQAEQRVLDQRERLRLT